MKASRDNREGEVGLSVSDTAGEVGHLRTPTASQFLFGPATPNRQFKSKSVLVLNTLPRP